MKIRGAAYAPVLALAMGAMLARLLIMARLLPIHEFSAYSVGILISSSFCMLGCLGLQSLLQKDLPAHIVRGRERAGAILATQCLGVAGSCAAGLILAVAYWGSELAVDSQVIIIGLLHGLSQQAFLIVTVESRSRGATMRYALDSLARALVVTAAGAAVVILGWGAKGALLAEGAISLGAATLLWRSHMRTAGLSAVVAIVLGVKRVLALPWATAFSLLAVMLLSFVAANADRWVAMVVLDVDGFGQYAFAWIVLMAAQSTQAVVNASFYPGLARERAVRGDSAVFAMARRASLLLLALGGVLVIPAWAVLDATIACCFEAYVPATALLPFLLVAAVVRISDFWSSYLIICGHEQDLVRVNLAVLFGAGLTWWVGLAGGPTPENVATLAVLLAVGGYATIGTVAWRISRLRGNEA